MYSELIGNYKKYRIKSLYDNILTINSPSNLMRIFKNNLKETGMMLGQLFIPMLSKVVPILNGVTIAFKRLLVNIASFMGVELDLDAFGQGYNDLEDDTGSLGDSYDDLAESIKAAKNQLLGFDEVNKLQEPTSVTGIDGDSIDLTDEILKATSYYEKIWQEAFDKMEANSNKWADAIEKALSGIGDVFEDFALGEYFKAGEDVSQLVIDLNNFIAKAIKNVDWKGLGNNVGLFLKGIKWTEIIMSLSDVIYSAFDGLWDAWIEMMKESPIETALLTAIALTRIDVVRNALTSKLATVGGTASSPLKISTYLTVAVLGIQIAETLGEMIGEALVGDFDPWVYINADNEQAQRIQDIVDKYETLNSNVEKYIELSKNYENLSEEEKGYVYQMGKELEDAGIVTGINDITKAWEGTNEELIRAIELQMLYSQIASSMEYEADLRRQLKEKEAKLISLHDEYVALGVSGLLTTPWKETEISSDIDETQAAIDELRNSINDTSLEIKQYEQELERLKNLGKNPFDFTIDWSNIPDEGQKELDEYLEKLGEAKENSELNVDVDGVTNGVRTATRKLTQFKIDSEESGRVNLYLNSNGFINALNYAGGFMDSKVSLMNSKAVQLIVNSSAFEQAINNGVNLFDGKINQMNSKKVEPKLSNDEVEKGLGKTSSLFNSTINALNSKNITPEINTDGAKQGIENVLKLYNDNLSNIKSTVEFETDEKSFKGLFSAIQEKLSNTKFQLEVESGVAQGAMLGIGVIKQYKMGGFPEDGLFFANHNELVGGFSNGKTAVANNEQITQGIAQAVAPAVYNAVVSAMQNTQRGNSDVVVNIDGKQVFKAVQRQANDYTAQTGLSPFNI